MATAKLDYVLPPEPVHAARTFEEVVEAKSNRGGWGPSDEITFDIPTGQKNAYLDPSKTWLEFTLVNKSQTASSTYSAVQLDGNAYSVFRNISLYDRPGGTVLEAVREAPTLYNLIKNATSGLEPSWMVGSLTEGYLPARFAVNDATLYFSATRVDGDYEGQYLERFDAADPNPQSQATQTFGIGVMSTLGLLGSKYLPVHALNRKIRLSLDVNEASAVFKQCRATITSEITDDIQAETGGAPYPNIDDVPAVMNFTINDVRLHLTYVQIPDDAQAAIRAATGNVYSWCDTTYQHHRGIFDGLSLAGEILIPAHLSSARHVLSVLRPVTLQTSVVNRFTSFFPKNYITSAQYRLGTKPIPRWPMKSVAAVAKNYLACLGADDSSVTRVNAVNFWVDEGFNYTTDTGATYCLGVDLGGPCGDDFNYFMGGANTLGDELWLRWEASSNLSQTTYVDSFVAHDALFRIDEYGNFTVST